ncbi:putative ATG8, partial [Halocaridina rubra]
KMKFQYKETTPFYQRRALGQKLRRRHPNKVPVIVEKSPKARLGNGVIKKYLIPFECTVGHLYFLIRKQLNLRPEEALILCVRNVIPSSSVTMGSVYHHYHDSDLLLYVSYQDENVYGANQTTP